MQLEPQHNKGKVGVLVARKHWGKGFATEALQAVLAFGFETIGLQRIEGNHFIRNPASGRVMEKCGMRQEGICRQHVHKNGGYEDMVLRAILKSDWITGPGAWI